MGMVMGAEMFVTVGETREPCHDSALTSYCERWEYRMVELGQDLRRRELALLDHGTTRRQR